VRGKSWLLAAGLIGLLCTQLALAGGNHLWAAYVNGPKVTIINNSGYPADQVYLVFLARPYSESFDYNKHRIKWTDSTFPLINVNDNTETFGDYSYANYSTTLSQLSHDSITGHHFFYLPKKVDSSVADGSSGFDAGRLWLSFGTPPYFRVFFDDNLGHITIANPTFMNPANPNANTIFDFFEPQLATDGVTVHADTTNVESIAMPLLYELKNGAASLGKKGLNRPLRALRGAFLSDPVFKGLVTPVAIMAPGHGIELGKLSSVYFDKYVTHCWKHWKDNTLTFQYPKGVTWSGKVGVDDRLALTGTVNSTEETHYIGRPASRDIFFCDGVFSGVNHDPPITDYVIRDAGLKNQVSSALNRTVMHLAPYPTATITEYPWESYKPPSGSGVNLFYQQNGLTNENYQTNVYSKILHQLSFDGTIYGFAYDDNAKQASYLDGVATDIILTIGNCRGSIAPFLGLLID
jgi:hypothetical protein